MNTHEIKFIAPINGVFMDKLMEIKMGFNISLHIEFSKAWISIDTIDSLLYF